MEAIEPDEQAAVNQLYEYSADQLVNHKKTPDVVVATLIEQGLNSENATIIVNNLTEQLAAAKKERAKKDMLYGALWCAGGTVATLADVGFIFWGAIVFGGIQLVKGMINSR